MCGMHVLRSVHVFWSSLDLDWTSFAAWQRAPFMCRLPGPTHQSLSRNMPLPRARSDFSPYHSIKATLPFLMEGVGGACGGVLVIFHQSHRQYIPSHHIEGAANGCSPCGSNLERMPGSARWSHWPKTHMRIKFQVVRVTIGVIWKGKVHPFYFLVFCLILQRIVPIIKTSLPPILLGVTLPLLHQLPRGDP